MQKKKEEEIHECHEVSILPLTTDLLKENMQEVAGERSQREGNSCDNVGTAPWNSQCYKLNNKLNEGNDARMGS